MYSTTDVLRAGDMVSFSQQEYLLHYYFVIEFKGSKRNKTFVSALLMGLKDSELINYLRTTYIRIYPVKYNNAGQLSPQQSV